MLSVLIPTKDRSPLLARTLDALEAQQAVGGRAEVVIIDNGSSDGTVELVRRRAAGASMPIQVLEHPMGGPAAARNAGVAAAGGEILLFLGDDTEPEGADLLRSHLDLHDARPEESYGVLGHIAWSPRSPVTPHMHWLINGGPQSHYWALKAGSVEPALFFYGSHVSLKRSLFDRLGGFDERFPAAALEDTELGARLAWAGFELDYRPELLVLHDHPSAPAQSLDRSVTVGRSAVLYNRLRPERPHPGLLAPRGLRGAPLAAAAAPLGALARAPLPAGLRERVWSAMTQAGFARGYRRAVREEGKGSLMSRARSAFAAAALCICLGALAPAGASAATAAWTLTLTPLPANLTPGEGGELLVIATNVGGAPTAGSASVLEVSLPAGVIPLTVTAKNSDFASVLAPSCAIEALTRTVKCETAEPIGPGRRLVAEIPLEVTAPEGTLDLLASVGGGGATQQANLAFPAKIQPDPIPFDFLPLFGAPANNADGTAAVLAGSHPYQQTFDFGFPTKKVGKGLTNDGHARNFYFELPRGMVGNPGASPVLCTEAELTSIEGCPEPSQVGISDVTTLFGEAGTNLVFTGPLYNMVPPPGYPAEIAVDVADVGIFAHVLTSLRSGKDYGIETSVRDVIAFGQQPIFSVQAQIWGDPSSPAHEGIRGRCSGSKATCEVDPVEIPLLTMPGDCPGQPLGFEALADSWEEPSPPGELREALYESADLEGNQVQMEGCNALQFKPTIEARPTTTAADSPAGLDFSLHQPQEEPHPEPLAGRATAILKDATVTFPAGLAVNPAQASGLDACSEDQIGFEEEGEEGALFFSENPQSCPDAAKIGTVQAATPLLVQRDPAHEVEIDPQTGAPAPEPLHGSVYLARPFANPFDSLVALYLVVEDPKTGIVAKLAGEGELDSATGQITTRFKESPEAPIEDIHVHIFGGDRGALITPQACGAYDTQAELTPWSAPEAEVEQLTDSFEVNRAPSGGPCPAQAPFAPRLRAGTLEPTAGKYSPLLFKLSREDGSERLARLEATLPPGLTAKLAGVAQCSEAGIAKAISREAPDKGAAELADPSCPAASQVGTVTVGAGAGPTPFYTTGRAYLSGPYKGAPLSIVIITPAVAGPFDLGAVVVRSAVYLDPETAQPRTVSDPLPQLLDGIPVDVRSVALRLDRPKFSLNPTSCDEKHFSGAATSALGRIAPLTERFQLGGCRALPFKPKLSLRLFGATTRGAHPRLRAVLTAKPGEAGIARTVVALPHSEFIDQAHFRTICTRVQFAAKACPQGSVYGHLKAITPLLDTPLEGPVYLRSSSHELPDVVAALHGPPSMPIELDLDGRVDSVNGGVRTIFANVPDAPVTKVILTMQGKRKGLFQNSTNICKGTHRASVKMDGQNGKAYDTRPALNASCPKKKAKPRHRGHHRRS